MVKLEVLTKIANHAARVWGCEVRALASSLVFLLDGVLIVVRSGAFLADREQFATVAAGTHVRRVRFDDARVATGQSIGGVFPVGRATTVPVFIDEPLISYDCIWAAYGTPHSVFATTFDELSALTGALAVALVEA